MEEEETLVLYIFMVVGESLEQEILEEGTLEEDLMDMEEDIHLGMAIMGLEVAIWGLALVMEENEEDMVVDMATRMGAPELVMTTTEEEIMEVKITVIQRIISRNPLSTNY